MKINPKRCEYPPILAGTTDGIRTHTGTILSRLSPADWTTVASIRLYLRAIHF